MIQTLFWVIGSLLTKVWPVARRDAQRAAGSIQCNQAIF
jgi:hypothetical protein